MQQLIEMLQKKLDSMGVQVDLSKLDTAAIISKMSNMEEMKNEVISQLSSKFDIDNDTATQAVDSVSMEEPAVDMDEMPETTEELNSKVSDEVTKPSSAGMDHMNGLVDKVKGFFGNK